MITLLASASAFDLLALLMGAFVAVTGVLAWRRIASAETEFPWTVFAIIYFVMIAPGVAAFLWGVLRLLGAHL